jgi:hypothetical protein
VNLAWRTVTPVGSFRYDANAVQLADPVALFVVAAATKALQSVALGLLEEHLGHCVAGAIAEGGDAATEKVREASDAIARLVKS